MEKTTPAKGNIFLSDMSFRGLICTDPLPYAGIIRVKW